MSSNCKLDVERYQRIQNRSSPRTPTPTSTTSISKTKTVMTFKELQNSLGKSAMTKKPRSSISAPLTPRTPSRSSSVTAASPLTQRIRQQILKSHEESTTPSTPQTATKSANRPPVSDRRKRLEKNQHLVSSTSRASPVTPMRTPKSTTPTLSLRTSTATATVLSPMISKKKTVEPRRTLSVSTSVNKTTRPKNKALTPPLIPKSATKKAVTPRTPLAAMLVNSTSTPLSSAAVNNNDTCDKSTRRNLDKRSARLRFSNEFSAEIAKFRRDSLSSATTNAATPTPTTPPAAAVASSGVSVFVRKRPMFAHETARNDFDVVADSATKENSDDTVAGTVTVYRTVMHADMKTCMVQPVHFNCTEFFDETCESAQVYHAAALPLVQAAQQGGVATLLMFGQTGSGKTYTMTALEELCAEELFERRTGCGKVAVTVQFLELCGKICRDLVDDAGQEVRIMDNDNGSVCFVNAAEAVADDAQELCAVIAKAKERRATQVTDKNDESSRSHAVCQLTIRDESSPQQRGVLTLVDCAGTERRNDSLYHSRSRQAESKEINASLYALKECIRARSSQRKDRHVPYRSNNLTRVLRESLERADARLAVIATVAPNATDTEHTIQTLKTIATLSGGAPEEGQLQKLTPLVDKSGGLPIAPKKWNHGALIAWLTEKRLIQKQQQIPEHFDGRFVMRMSKLQLRNAFYGDGEMAKAELLFKYLRSETDRANRLDLKRRMNKPN